MQGGFSCRAHRGPISGPGYAVGDGLIVKDPSYLGNPLAVTPGTTITAVDGSTLTLSGVTKAHLTVDDFHFA